MHHVLAKRGYSPAGIIFPISAAILRDRHSYAQALATFSKPLSEFVDWRWTSEQEITVTNDTSDLYRYFDATVFAEYLYGRVADTVRRDLKEELGFVAVFDRAFTAVREIVDMPDRRASLYRAAVYAKRRTSVGCQTPAVSRIERCRDLTARNTGAASDLC
jgi:hypothetical protein